MLRKCRVCGLEAHNEDDLILFAKNKNKKHGCENLCKKCNNEKTKKYYHNLPEEKKQKMIKRIAEWNKKQSKEYKQLRKKHQQERRRGRFLFKEREIVVKENPRNGICSICGKTEVEEGKQLAIHHIIYDDKNPLAHTIEVCSSCHAKIHGLGIEIKPPKTT